METRQVFISFKGTDSFQALPSDLDIMLNTVPRSYSEKMQIFLNEALNKFENDGYNVTFVGHSLGAVQASLASSQYKRNAICFDNPKLNMKRKDDKLMYDFSKVVNLQSPANLINAITTDKNNGILLELNSDSGDLSRSAIAAVAAGLVGNVVAPGLVNGLALGIDHLTNLHSLNRIGQRMEEQLN